MDSPDKEWWLAHSADYVLGVLGPQDRKVFERIMHYEPDVQAMVRDWRATLQPMADSLTPIDAPEHILPALLSDLPVQALKPVNLNYQGGKAVAVAGAAAVAGGTVVAGRSDDNGSENSGSDNNNEWVDVSGSGSEDAEAEPMEPIMMEGSTVMNYIKDNQKSANRWRAYAGWATVACIGFGAWVYHLLH